MSIAGSNRTVSKYTLHCENDTDAFWEYLEGAVKSEKNRFFLLACETGIDAF